MPIRKPQELKSLSTIAMQPKRESSRMEVILCMDLAGRTGKQIGQELGLGDCRVSVIRNSPLYMKRLDEMRGDLREQFVDKRSDKLSSGDPVEELLKDQAIVAMRKKIGFMEHANPVIASAAAGDVLDRAGYKSHTEKTKITVEVTEKMANRFETALNYEPRNDDRKTKVRFTQEMS